MADEPTAGEVSRSLAQFQADTREAFRDLREQVRDGHRELTDRINQGVPAAEYAADQRLSSQRYEDLRAQLRDIQQASADRLQDIQQARADRAANRKWVIAAVIIPIGIGLLDIIFAIHGVK